MPRAIPRTLAKGEGREEEGLDDRTWDGKEKKYRVAKRMA